MKLFPNSEVAISNRDRAEIETIFIELMRRRDAAPNAGPENSEMPLFDPPGSSQNLRSQWGLQ
jgi:hypothetical protein